jgi:hypothetical protein
LLLMYLTQTLIFAHNFPRLPRTFNHQSKINNQQ